MFQLKAFDELSWKGMTLNQICSIKMAKRRTRIARIRISVHNRSNMFWHVKAVCHTCLLCILQETIRVDTLEERFPVRRSNSGFSAAGCTGAFSFRTQSSFHNRKFPVERRSKELACDVSHGQGQWDHPCTYYITIRRERYLRL